MPSISSIRLELALAQPSAATMNLRSRFTLLAWLCTLRRVFQRSKLALIRETSPPHLRIDLPFQGKRCVVYHFFTHSAIVSIYFVTDACGGIRR